MNGRQGAFTDSVAVRTMCSAPPQTGSVSAGPLVDTAARYCFIYTNIYLERYVIIMDIRSVEVAVERMFAYVSAVKHSDKKLYRPSVVRLQKIRDICLQCADMIADATGIEASTESAEESHDDLLSKIRDLVDAASHNTVEHHIQSKREPAHRQVSKPKLTDVEMKEVTKVPKGALGKPKSNLTSADRKYTLHKYAMILHTTADRDDIDEHTASCAKLVWQWFNARFLLSKGSDFHYDVARIPAYIQAFLQAYEHHCEVGKLTSFAKEVDKWCDAVTDDKKNIWALPFSVQQVYAKKFEPNCSKLFSTWLSLMDAGWQGLMDDAKLKPITQLSVPTVHI